MLPVTDLTLARAERGLESSYQRQQDRRDAEARTLATVKQELRAKLLKAIADGHGQIPFVGERVVGNVRFDGVKHEPVAETVLADAMDYDDVGAAVMTLLSRSQCPYAAALRCLIVERIVEQRADLLTEFAS